MRNRRRLRGRKTPALLRSDEKHERDLDDDHAQEHADGIDRGVGDRRIVAFDGVVGVVEGHGVGHAAAQQSRYGAEIDLQQPHRRQTHHDDRDERQHEAHAQPENAFGPHDGFEEVRPGVEAQTGEVHRKPQRAQHEVGALRGIGNHVHPGAERADENAHDDRAARQSQFHGDRDARHGDRDASEREAEDQADENRREVRFVEALHGVAEDLLDVADRLRLAHDRQAVAQLQSQVGRGEQLHARTVNAADVDAVVVAQAQCRELLAVDFGARHQDALRHELSVHRVPVDVLRVPVLLLLFAEDEPQGVGLVAVGDDQNDVVALQLPVRRGNRDLSVAPEARDDEVVVALGGDVVDALAEDGGIREVVAGDEEVLLVLGVGSRHVRRADEEFAQGDDRQDDAHDPQRIGHRAAQRRAVGIEPRLLEGLLRRAECRGVGRGAAEDTRHVGHRNPEGVAQGHGQRRSSEYDGDGRGDQAQSVGAHRAEKARADLQAEGIDEDDEAEILGIGEHRRVERQSEVPGQNAHEEDEGRAERDAEEPDFSQSDADCRDERNHHDGL